MKKYIIIAILILLSLGVHSQDSNALLDTFLQNFEKATNEVKYQILLDAVDMGMTGFGPLYLKALNYIIDNQKNLLGDSTLRQIAIFAVEQILKSNYTDGADSVWKYFVIDPTNENRLKSLEALQTIAKENTRIIKGLCAWLDEQNSSFRAGATPDLQVIHSAVDTLGIWADDIAFMPLFYAMKIKYSEEIRIAAEQAILKLPGDPKDLYMGVIRNRHMDEKLDAIRAVLRMDEFSDEDKAELSMAALEVALHSNITDTHVKQTARLVRFNATEELSRQNWTEATTLAIEHFNDTIEEYDKGISARSFLLSAIRALGNMKNHDAAVRLTLYLDLLNSYTENSMPYDEQVIMAVIQGLEKLGDNVSTSTLLYTRYLNYNETIKKAALKAIKELN